MRRKPWAWGSLAVITGHELSCGLTFPRAGTDKHARPWLTCASIVPTPGWPWAAAPDHQEAGQHACGCPGAATGENQEAMSYRAPVSQEGNAIMPQYMSTAKIARMKTSPKIRILFVIRLISQTITRTSLHSSSGVNLCNHQA